MPQVIYTQQSQEDIKRCHRFLFEKDSRAAIAAIKTIHHALHILEQHPEAGRPVEGYSDEFREWIIDYGEGGYVALYQFDGSSIVILAIKHQKEIGYVL